MSIPRKAQTTLPFFLVLAVVMPMASGCGGGAGEDRTATPDDAVNSSEGRVGQQVARADFVLCPAFETVAPDLASLFGFELDAERGVEAMVGECFVRGENAEYVSLSLAPGVIRSVAMQASGYESNATPADELGEGAVLIDDPTQPHVIFELLGHILDLGVELYPGVPDRETLIRAGMMTRDALVTANGG